MSFLLLPPEVNSGRMYTGPGSGPMLAAAAAWDGLAGELYSTAQQHGSTVSDLTGDFWSGPSAIAMQKAAAPQVAWLYSTAAQAEQAASQARAAAGAYETAYAMTVPPAVVAANRAQLQMLVATNLFGRNAPAIAANEAQYAEMWAQDAEAMRDYATASAMHSALTPFSTPEQHTNPGAQVAQAGTHAETVLSAGQQLLASGPQALQGLAAPAAPQSTALPAFLQWLYSLQIPSGLATLQAAQNNPLVEVFLGINWIHGLLGLSHTTYGLQEVVVATGGVPGVLPEAAAPFWAEFPFWEGVPAGTIGAVTGGMGQASLVGGLAVPPSWTTSAPALQLAAAAMPTASLSGITGSGLFSGMPALGITPLVAMPGRGAQDDDSDDEESSETDERRSAVAGGSHV